VISNSLKIDEKVMLNIIDKPVNTGSINYLYILMLLQSKSADFASENQKSASKDRRSAVFSQSIAEEMEKIGSYSLETAGKFKAFLKQISERFDPEKIGYSEELMLKQMGKMFEDLESLKSKMEQVQKGINELQSKANALQNTLKSHQKSLDEYTKKYKEGGFIIPGYNVYLAAKMLEYKNKRDNAQKDLTLTNAEINSVKKPELEALKADALRIQKGFEGNLKTEATIKASNAADKLAQADAILESAMQASLFLDK
jgi:polyhydroxyalkanoate synthesis regulator phasin